MLLEFSSFGCYTFISNMKLQKVFTFLELLVVITITGILASIVVVSM
jgi:prepilin-type N-terminal cleavage/methylation domain-containing protein